MKRPRNPGGVVKEALIRTMRADGWPQTPRKAKRSPGARVHAGERGGDGAGSRHAGSAVADHLETVALDPEVVARLDGGERAGDAGCVDVADVAALQAARVVVVVH